MCTSFIFRGLNTIIGMNFDNNGMSYSIATKIIDWFVVNVDGGRGKYPSFGVNKDGIFFNNLVVDSNGKGLYKRPSTKVTHTSKLVTDILKATIDVDQLSDYLSSIEVVNTPDWSCHNMIIDAQANVHIIEPGRGNIFSKRNESEFYIMSNESIIDMHQRNNVSNCNRYNAIKNELTGINNLDSRKAFSVLEKAFQTEGEWKTDLSIVFSKGERKVYYCENRNLDEIAEYSFENMN